MTMTFEDLEVRESLMDMRRDLPAIQRIYSQANDFDLRKIRDPKQRERLRRVRELSKQLQKELL